MLGTHRATPRDPGRRLTGINTRSAAGNMVTGSGMDASQEVHMKRMAMWMAIAALPAFNAAGCGAREQTASCKAGKYRGKTDARPGIRVLRRALEVFLDPYMLEQALPVRR